MTAGPPDRTETSVNKNHQIALEEVRECILGKCEGPEGRNSLGMNGAEQFREVGETKVEVAGLPVYLFCSLEPVLPFSPK